MRSRARAHSVAGLLCALALAASCARPTPDERYRPSQSVLEVVAVLTRHVEDDTYRFEPARDFTGRNVYRASLLRLEGLEKVHEASLRAGYMDDVVAFSKGRAFERLRAPGLAAQSYALAARKDGPLREDALRSADLCERLSRATAAEAESPADAQALEARYAERRARLEGLLEEAAGTHYEAVIREELEYADVARARALAARRHLAPDGDVAALSAFQRVVVDHRDSKNANRHLLELGDLYADLAEEYVDVHPPESLGFEPPAFADLVESATRLYEAVANQDGAIERIEAARRLEAFLAFTLRVDRDRFTP